MELDIRGECSVARSDINELAPQEAFVPSILRAVVPVANRLAAGCVRAFTDPLRGGSTAITHYQNDHDAIDQLADTCMTCIAFAGVVGSAPPSALSVSFASFTGNSYSLFSATPVFRAAGDGLPCS